MSLRFDEEGLKALQANVKRGMTLVPSATSKAIYSQADADADMESHVLSVLVNAGTPLLGVEMLTKAKGTVVQIEAALERLLKKGKVAVTEPRVGKDPSMREWSVTR